MEFLRDPLVYMTRDELIVQFEDRSAHCKKCGSVRRLLMFEEMPEEFITTIKEEAQGRPINDKVSYRYCYNCDEYSDEAKRYFKKKEPHSMLEEVNDIFTPVLDEVPF